MTMREFRELLHGVDRSYDDFVSLVISFVKIPENRTKGVLIKEFIESHPYADSSSVLQYMIDELGMAEMPEIQIPTSHAISQ